MKKYSVVIVYASIIDDTTISERFEIIHNVMASSEEEAIGKAYRLFENTYPDRIIVNMAPALSK